MEKRRELMIAVVDRWLIQAPEEAVAAMLGLPESNDRRFLLHRLVSGWSKMDAGAVFSTLRALDDIELRQELRVVALTGLQSVDRAAVVGWLNSLPNSTHHREFFSDWIEADLEGAKQSVALIRNPEGQECAARLVAKPIAIRDPAGALTWAEGLAQEPARSTAMTTVLAVMAWNNPAAALDAVERMPAGANRNEAMSAVLERWGKRDPSSALSWVKEQDDGEVVQSTIQSLIFDLAEHDPQAALTFLDVLPSEGGRQMTLSQVIDKAAASDPQGTANWVEQLSEADRSAAMETLVRAWASVDVRKAAQYIEELGTDEHPRPGIAAIASHWSRADPAAAVEWAESLPEQEKFRALESAVGTWAESDPVGAAKYLATQDGTEFQKAAAGRVVQEWGRWEPGEAAAWVEAAFDDPEIRGPSYQALAAIWLNAYPREASVWIDTLPQGSDRDAAVTVLLQILAPSDPETAGAWAETLSDPGMRETWKSKLEGGSQH